MKAAPKPRTATVAKVAGEPKVARISRANYKIGEELQGRTAGETYTCLLGERDGHDLVTITSGPRGFTGKEYPSLSAAAKDITGYSVSGNVWWRPVQPVAEVTGTRTARKAPAAKKPAAKKPTNIATKRAAPKKAAAV